MFGPVVRGVTVEGQYVIRADRFSILEKNFVSSLNEPTHQSERANRIRGEVLHGDKVGRVLGFPTANMLVSSARRPAYGIYAVRVHLPDGRVLDGAANFGIRPTFSPPKELFETHILDFSEDLYGQTIDVELVSFLRPEAIFDDMESLAAQLERDCVLAREMLASVSVK